MKKIGFLFWGSNQIGMGHVYRNISLLKKMKDCYDVHIFVNENDNVKLLLCSEDISFEIIELENIDSIVEVIAPHSLDVLLIDKLDNTREEIQKIKTVVGKVITLDDQGNGAMYSDALINAIVPLPSVLPHKYFHGPQYMIFNDYIETFSRLDKKIKENVTRIMICFGGSDPQGITKLILPCLKRYESIHFTVVLGPAYIEPQSVIDLYKDSKNIEVLYNLPSLANLIHESDLCIISGGITLFECIFLRTPAAIISQVEHQKITAENYATRGCVFDWGYGKDFSEKKIINLLDGLINDFEGRRLCQINCKKVIDENGIYKVKAIIENLLEREE